MTSRHVFLSCAILATSGLLAGCASPHVVAVDKTGAPKYRNVDIVYELASDRELQQQVEVRQVDSATNGANQETPTPVRDWARTSLRVRYPHPDGRADMAQVTLRLSELPLPLDPVEPTWRDRAVTRVRAIATGRSSTNEMMNASHVDASRAGDEIRTIDLPRHQLDLLLTDLAYSGFFGDQQRPTGRARLSVRIDGGHNLGTWDPEPRLDEIVSRVFREGTLEGFAPQPQRAERRGRWSF